MKTFFFTLRTILLIKTSTQYVTTYSLGQGDIPPFYAVVGRDGVGGMGFILSPAPYLSPTVTSMLMLQLSKQACSVTMKY